MKNLVAFFAAAAALCLIAGCATQPEPAGTPGPAKTETPAAGETSTGTPEAAPKTDDTSGASSATGATQQPTAFRHNGDLYCPIMKQKIRSEADAVGYVDYEGTRYYMCCESCLTMAKNDPKMAADAAAKL